MVKTPKKTAAQEAAEARERIHAYWADISRRNYFELFGGDQDTDPERLKSAYHGLVRQWHTDRFTGVDLGDARETLEMIFKQINEAYETITDPKRRIEYMVYLDRRRKGLSTDVSAVLEGERQLDEALAKIRRQDWAGAREILEAAAKLNPDDPMIMVHFGWVTYQSDRKDEANVRMAVDLLKKAIKRQENLALAYQYLGNIYFASKRAAEARKYWKQCVDWEPNNIEAARGLRLLATREAKESSGFGAFVNKLFKRK